MVGIHLRYFAITIQPPPPRLSELCLLNRGMSSKCIKCHMMPSFPNLTLTVITDQGKSHCDRNTKIVPTVTNWDSVVMSVLSLLCLPTLRKNITIFPYHELHIKTRANYKVPLCVFTTSLTLFLPLCVTALCSHDSKDKEFSTDLQKCWFTGGQRSPTELKSVLVFRDWTFRWRTPQQGERCIEPSCIYLRSFINYLSFGSRCVLCCLLSRCVAHLFVLRHPINTLRLALTWKTDFANQQRSRCLQTLDDQLYLEPLVAMETLSSL